jgi:monoamine oxidase
VQGNDPESREWLCRKLEQALGLPLDILKMTAIKKYYWHEGTHYYIPFAGNNTYETWITKAKNPEAGIYVVGEMISRDQGWVEGAIQSVENVF